MRQGIVSSSSTQEPQHALSTPTPRRNSQTTVRRRDGGVVIIVTSTSPLRSGGSDKTPSQRRSWVRSVMTMEGSTGRSAAVQIVPAQARRQYFPRVMGRRRDCCRSKAPAGPKPDHCTGARQKPPMSDDGRTPWPERPSRRRLGRLPPQERRRQCRVETRLGRPR